MNDEQMNDPVLLTVRSARPAPVAVEDRPSSAEAHALLEHVLSPPPATPGGSRGRCWWPGGLAPLIGCLTAIAVAAIALVGLSHRGRSRAPSPTATPKLTLSADQYVFAVGGDASPRTSREQLASGLVLFRAEQILRARCMQQRGFRYVAVAPPAVSALASATGYPTTFYPEPIASAYPEQLLLSFRQSHGFGIHPSFAGSSPQSDPNETYLKHLKPARQRLWRQAFNGRNGCDGTAEVQLFGSRRAANLEGLVPSQVYDHLNAVVYTRSGAIAGSSSRTASAAAAWSRCMHAATGQSWADEDALVSSLPNHLTRHEISLALTDTRCAYSSRQAQTFAAAFRQAANHLPSQLQADLGYLLAHRGEWVRHARRIVASARP